MAKWRFIIQYTYNHKIPHLR